MRAFMYQSSLGEDKLVLALAPALTPAGIDSNPSFFRGFAAHPQVLARGLLVLADVTSTRYFHYTPAALRDPVLSAQGNTLRAECFSACNSVYARLDLSQPGLEGAIGRGTTNVDIGLALRAALMQISHTDKLHVDIGCGGLTATPVSGAGEAVVHMGERIHERAVQMPERWVRALGNAAEIHRSMKPVFQLKGAQAQSFVASLPSATGKNQSGWLTPVRTGAKLMPRRTPGAVYASGLNRLSALKRCLTHISAMTFYHLSSEEPGPFMAEAELPAARLTLSLTAEAWQGYSGEGALLASLARPDVLEDAGSIAGALCFDAAVEQAQTANRWSMSESRAKAALAFLAVSGKLGFDAREGAYFHRELPDEPERAWKDNPRLKAARGLLEQVKKTGVHQWVVRSGETEYRVSYPPDKTAKEAKCTCAWYLKHQNQRGPCKHILAVQLKEGYEA